MTTSAEVRSAREYLGADPAALGRMLSVNEKTIRRWEAGQQIPDQVGDDLWDLIDAHQRLVDQLADQARETGTILTHVPITGDDVGRAHRRAAAQAWALVPDTTIDYLPSEPDDPKND